MDILTTSSLLGLTVKPGLSMESPWLTQFLKKINVYQPSLKLINEISREKLPFFNLLVGNLTKSCTQIYKWNLQTVINITIILHRTLYIKKSIVCSQTLYLRDVDALLRKILISIREKWNLGFFKEITGRRYFTKKWINLILILTQKVARLKASK